MDNCRKGEGLVVFADILGFSSIKIDSSEVVSKIYEALASAYCHKGYVVAGQDVREIVDNEVAAQIKLSEREKSIVESGQEAIERKIVVGVISDSIVCAADMTGADEEAKKLLTSALIKIVFEVNASLWAAGLPIRGGIAYGEFHYNDAAARLPAFFMGEAVMKAHALEMDTQAACISVDESAEEFCRKYYDKTAAMALCSEEDEPDLCLGLLYRKKKKVCKKLCINFPREIKLAVAENENVLVAYFSSYGKEVSGKTVRKKISNTGKLIKYIVREAMALHVVPGLGDVANGMSSVARLLVHEHAIARLIDLKKATCGDVASAGEVWVHGMWLPREWLACWRVIRAGRKLVRMTHGSLSPMYLANKGRLKKRLVGPIERWLLRRSNKVVATCKAEKEWIEAYVGRGCPPVEIIDIKKFFDLSKPIGFPRKSGMQTVHVLYLGREHPLKGVVYLKSAVGILNRRCRMNFPETKRDSLELRVVTDAQGAALEEAWRWCDVLVLPTLSENFGLVVAEALERGKPVITTDGAPAWADLNDNQGIYLKGFVEGDDETRVQMLQDALSYFID